MVLGRTTTKDENGAASAYREGAAVANEAVLLWRVRTRVRVWPGRSDAPQIVASAPSRARVGDCFPASVLPLR